MQLLDDCPPEQLRRLRGVLTDIDDTLTTDGCLTADAYRALEDLHRSGLLVIPITGRPAGWCDHIARMWPVDGVVGENGAFWFLYDRAERRMRRYFVAGADERRAQKERLNEIAAIVLREVPKARIASDQQYREADLAIDYCEDVEPLSDAEVARIVSVMTSEGLTVKVSSIHVNGWHGSHDKLATTLALLDERFRITAAEARNRLAFIGDSPNDQPMFEYFSCSVGVANVRAFDRQLAVLPCYVTRSARGAGFAEFASRIVRAMGSPS